MPMMNRKPKVRSATDPRVLEIVAAFERQLDTNRGASSVDGFVSHVLDVAVDRFVIPEAWPLDAIRSVLLAFVLNAPDEDLDEMVSRARDEQSMMDAFDRGEDYYGEEVSP